MIDRRLRIPVALLVFFALGLLTPAAALLSHARAQEGAEEGEVEEREREAIVVLKGGQRIRGILLSQDSKGVRLRIANVETSIAADQVETVIVQRPVRERYEEMRAVIDDNDDDRLLILVEWLRDHKLLEEARLEVEHVLRLEPKNGDAIRLLQLIEEQIALRDLQSEGAAGSPAPRRDDSEDRPRRPRVGEFPLLTEEQVNLIKVYEIDLANPPRIHIERPTIDELLNTHAEHPVIPVTREGREAFRRKPAVEVLEAMFAARARELYDEVKVSGLPESLRRFRDDVNSTWLVNSCATTRCHGGSDAGRLLLYNRTPTAEQAVATNLLILERFRLSEGGGSLIDYAQPEQSVLLQMGLIREDAARPHPLVRGWSPVFRSRSDRRYEQAIRWIQTMHRPRPDYPVEFEPPTASHGSAPEGPDR
ncbi:MAG: hypothetical protein VYC34_11660 [Planctomycetota bacterium]|nr:hypothetical protein [Planctomycetota bacterium]